MNRSNCIAGLIAIGLLFFFIGILSHDTIFSKKEKETTKIKEIKKLSVEDSITLDAMVEYYKGTWMRLEMASFQLRRNPKGNLHNWENKKLDTYTAKTKIDSFLRKKEINLTEKRAKEITDREYHIKKLIKVDSLWLKSRE